MHFEHLVATLVDTSNLPKASNSSNFVQIALDFTFGLAGSIALLMIVINGFRYIVARGEPSATASAKNGLIYAVVGLVVTLAMYSIVVFVVKGIG